MKEFIDKLIERLEEERKKVNRDNKNKFCPTTDLICKESAFIQAISIVNELAESYHIHCEQEYMRGYADAEKKLAEEYESWVMIDGQYCWQTCASTEHCKECRRLGNGDIDYYENIGEYINCSTDISTKSSGCSTKAAEMPTGWIPCSINKHNEINVAEKMWVTMHNKESKYFFVRRLMWNGCLRRWEWDNGKPISDMWEVVAWKKIDVPAPYTEGE